MSEDELVAAISRVVNAIYPNRECKVRFSTVHFECADKYCASLGGTKEIPFYLARGVTREAALVHLLIDIGYSWAERGARNGLIPRERFWN